MFVKPVRIATCCPAMAILNEHMRFSSTGRGPMNYSGSSMTLNSWPHADLIFGLERLSKPVFGALRRDVLFVASKKKVKCCSGNPPLGVEVISEFQEF